jgi:quinol monooxygenase YgiN
MSVITVMARVKAKPGKEGDLERAWRAAVGPSRAEPGCLGYLLHRSLQEPTLFVSVEKWASKDATERHLASTHVQEWLRQVPALVTSPPEILTYESLHD